MLSQQCPSIQCIVKSRKGIGSVQMHSRVGNKHAMLDAISVADLKSMIRSATTPAHHHEWDTFVTSVVVWNVFSDANYRFLVKKMKALRADLGALELRPTRDWTLECACRETAWEAALGSRGESECYGTRSRVAARNGAQTNTIYSTDLK